MSELCFQLKGSVVTTFILELYRYSTEEFTQQLSEKINQAPEFFTQLPVVINLDKMHVSAEQVELNELLALCREFNLQPMAFCCSDARFIDAVKATGLALVSDVTSRSIKKELPEVAKESAKLPAIEKKHQQKSKIISRPVRSGQQIYAEGGDLIILSQISEGAEVLADGNIHVYGSLRGRALAGVKGDSSSRVFCTSLEAELVSIAGHFILSDSLREKVWKKPAQVYLEDQSLHVEAV